MKCQPPRLRTGRLLGRYFAASRERLREVGAGLGMRRVPNRRMPGELTHARNPDISRAARAAGDCLRSL